MYKNNMGMFEELETSEPIYYNPLIQVLVLLLVLDRTKDSQGSNIHIQNMHFFKDFINLFDKERKRAQAGRGMGRGRGRNGLSAEQGARCGARSQHLGS